MSHDMIAVWCAFGDGPRHNFDFPRDLIEASTTGGKQEIVGFFNRLKVAREEINRAIEFKASFAEQFQPIVLTVISQLVARHALKVLFQKLTNPTDQLLASIRDSIGEFPYLKVLSETPSKLQLELVPVAFSFQEMALEAREIISFAVRKSFSPDKMAEWGMSHILAWTLEEFAHRKDLRDEVSGLSTEQAEEAIWNRAWRGEDFLGRYTQAVDYLAIYLANFLLELFDLENWDLAWIEALLGLRSSKYYLEIASRADRSGNAVLDWATRKYAGLPDSEALAVAETLREGSWRKFSDEDGRRRFIFRESRRRIREFDFIVLSSIGGLPGQKHFDVEHWQDCGLPKCEISLQDLTDGPFLESITDFRVIDTLISLKQAMKSLPLDTQRVMYARIQAYTREEAHKPLQISEERVAAAWKDLNRRKSRILKNILR